MSGSVSPVSAQPHLVALAPTKADGPPPTGDRRALIDWANRYLRSQGASTSLGSSVTQAIALVGKQYTSATKPADKARLADLGIKLVEAGERVGLLEGGQRAFRPGRAASRSVQPTTPAVPAAPNQAVGPAAPVPAAVAATAPVPASQPATPSPTAWRPLFDTQPFVQPNLTGGVSGAQFFGVGIQQGPGALNASWKAPSAKPLTALRVGVAVPNVVFLPGNTLDVIRPQAMAVFTNADGKGKSFQLRAGVDIEPNKAGRNPGQFGATYVNATKGQLLTRLDAQLRTSEGPGLGTAWALRAEQDVLRVGPDTVRLVATAWNSGRAGEATAVTAAATLNTPPDPFLFPGAGEPTPRLGVRAQVSRTPLPSPRDPGRAVTALGGTVELNSPRFRVSANVTQRDAPAATKTGVALSELTLNLNGQVRVGKGDTGQPPTDLAGISHNMPTGEWPASVRNGTNTTVYGSVKATLAASSPPSRKAPWGTGDKATIGIIHARQDGLVSAVSAEVAMDLDKGGPGGEASLWLRPVQKAPVFVHLTASANTDGTALAAGLAYMPSNKSVIKVGVRRVAPAGAGHAENRAVASLTYRF